MCYTLIRKKFEKYMKIEFFSHGKDETQAIGEKIGKIIARGSVITLDGDLGAGKTTFTQGLGKGLGINDTINSPTFNILKCYFNGRIPLYHIDAYRLEDKVNSDIGLEEMIQGDGVAVIEWSKFIPELVFEPLEIVIEIIDDNTRKINIFSCENKYFYIFEALKG